jgi:hypothetical protein
MSVRYKRHEHKPCEPGYSPHRGPGAQHVHLAPAIAARSSHAKILAPFTPGRRSGVRHQERREIPTDPRRFTWCSVPSCRDTLVREIVSTCAEVVDDRITCLWGREQVTPRGGSLRNGDRSA